MRQPVLARTVSLQIALLGVLSLATSGQAAAVEFAYTGDEGPGFWGELDVSTAACAESTRQSPIDLHRARRDSSLEALDLDLHPTEIHVVNNGHTLELEYEPGSTIEFDGAVYDLLQFHFHTLSEHTVRGRRFPMEMHAVFGDDSTGNFLVVGQFFKIDDDGEENSFLAEFDRHLPALSGGKFVSEESINLADGLVKAKKYLTYEGSLTTPPCSPIVTWIVLRKPASLSEAQFHAFRDIMGNNFRPLQDLNGRPIRRR